jgi:iron complex outermembrane recepter protein
MTDTAAYRAAHSFKLSHLSLLAQAAALLVSQSACAQASAPQQITITGNSRSNSASVAGFGNLPLASAPFSASVISTTQLQDAGITSLADITRLDAGITDAYNPPGYISQLAVRGFTLDNRFNYRRDGLPINAETAIGQANKQALEVLKGTSGLQAGTSAPGGLVNLVVKRPQRGVRAASLNFDGPGTAGLTLDMGDRLEGSAAIGWRINASTERLDPPVRKTRGSRSLLAAAFDAQITASSLIELELEASRQSQPSVPGFSLLGSSLPSAKAVDPRINLNNQSWSLPVVFGGQTGSIRFTQELGSGTDLVAHAMSQKLRTDDRIAFPSGCSAQDTYSRYCSDGSFDLYDFRSEGERRNSSALDVYVAGQAKAAGMSHRFNAGVLTTRFVSTFNRQAYNYSGTGTVDGLARLPADASLTDENTNRSERSTELHLQDRISLDSISPHTHLWLGLRSSQLHRSSVRTDTSRATAYSQTVSTPWVAVSHQLGAGSTAYISWGQGIESEVAPNRSRYNNPGQALAALKSEQVELGFKHSSPQLDWRVAIFNTQRPEWRDVGTCDIDNSCTRQADGQSRHSGVELDAEWRAGAFSLRGSALALRARRNGSAEPLLNGLRPTNVPERSVKLQGAYNVAALPGLALLAFASIEGQRMVLPDNSVATPGWSRLDLAARYSQQLQAGATATWRAGIDNITDQRAWKEAPYQYGHAYLYPLAPRVFHASLAVSF